MKIESGGRPVASDVAVGVVVGGDETVIVMGGVAAADGVAIGDGESDAVCGREDRGEGATPGVGEAAPLSTLGGVRAGDVVVETAGVTARAGVVVIPEDKEGETVRSPLALVGAVGRMPTGVEELVAV